MVSSLYGELGLVLVSAVLFVGCGTTAVSFRGDEELHASIAPAAVPPASPGLLGLLPEKKGEPRDPGEITGKPDFHWFVRFDLYGIYPCAAGGCRLGADRAHSMGVELHGAFVRVWDLETGLGVTVAGASALFVLGASGAWLGARADFLWEPGMEEGAIWCVGADVVWPLAGRWEVGCGAIFPVTVEEQGPPPVLPYVGVGVRF